YSGCAASLPVPISSVRWTAYLLQHARFAATSLCLLTRHVGYRRAAFHYGRHHCAASGCHSHQLYSEYCRHWCVTALISRLAAFRLSPGGSDDRKDAADRARRRWGLGGRGRPNTTA